MKREFKADRYNGAVQPNRKIFSLARVLVATEPKIADIERELSRKTPIRLLPTQRCTDILVLRLRMEAAQQGIR